MKKYFFVLMIVFSAACAGAATPAEYCSQQWHDTGQCPSEVCFSDCVLGLRYEGCPLSCLPKLCFDIPAESCPDNHCRLTAGCSGEDVCYHQDSPNQGPCGEKGYGGPSACCPGLKKVCGSMDFVTGSCDSASIGSAFQVPICLPCGDGICGHMENICNCPEDCAQAGRW